jgi:hypothetical protein
MQLLRSRLIIAKSLTTLIFFFRRNRFKFINLLLNVLQPAVGFGEQRKYLTETAGYGFNLVAFLFINFIRRKNQPFDGYFSRRPLDKLVDFRLKLPFLLRETPQPFCVFV